IFLSYASQYAKPFNEISGVVTELQNSVTCAQRIFDLLDEQEKQWVKDYNAGVYKTIAPLLNDEEAQWLKSKTL
ncbi:MAG: M24 family metallopeptidase C-terminal domain-containing protein, partial [Bacteroidales bacterium]|nr:M24 family metallopeptidase C-terminal domain-containing protein [Bacteroidales bacterium]